MSRNLPKVCVVGGGGGGWWSKVILVLSFSLSQAEQNAMLSTTGSIQLPLLLKVDNERVSNYKLDF